MAKAILSHLDGILAHCYLPIFNAFVEGFNNKIRWLVRRAYGNWDEECVKLKMYDLPRLEMTNLL